MSYLGNGQNRQDSGISDNRSFLLNGYIIDQQKVEKLYLKWILITTLGLFAIIEKLYQIIATFPDFQYDSCLEKVEFISSVSNSIIVMVQAVIICRLDWDYFWSYLDSLELLNIPSCEELRKKIQRKRIVKISIIASTLTIYVARGFILSPDFFSFSILYLMSCIGHFFIFITITEICICLQVAFESVNKQIVSCGYNRNQRLQLQDLLYYRQCWFNALEATQSAEKFLRHFITFFYVRFAVSCIFNHMKLFYHFKLLQFSSILNLSFFSIMNVVMIWYITANVISVNTFSQNCLEELYELTFKTDSIILEQQIYMFLKQVSKTDAGFTFGNLFLIAPNFIRSFLALTFTISITFLSNL